MLKKIIFGGVGLILLATPLLASAQSVNEQIASLLALLKSLQAQIVALQAQAGQGTSFCHTFNTDLKFGDQSEEVTHLDSALVREGFLDKDETFQDGRQALNFDETTASAVVSFQAKYGIRQTGYVGPKTRAKLNTLYGCRNGQQPTQISNFNPNSYMAGGDGICPTGQTWSGPIGSGNCVSQTQSITPAPSTQPFLTLLSPNGGEIWQGTAGQTIRWNSNNVTNGVVNIELVDYNYNPQTEDHYTHYTIVHYADNTGSYTINSNSTGIQNIKSGNNYKINIEAGQKTSATGLIDYDAPLVKGDSSVAPFSIVAATTPSITVLSPNGGESYKAGGQVIVKWRTSNVDSSGSNIWIHLDTFDGKHLDNGDLVKSHIQNTGEKTVTIPVDLPVGKYKMAVSVGQELEDTSDDYFTITSATTQPTLTQTQAQTLVLQTWGGCTPDTCGSVAVTVQNNNGQYTVTAIYEGLRDDSSSASRKVAPAHYDYGYKAWVLETPVNTQRCQPGRGHQDFSSEHCI